LVEAPAQLGGLVGEEEPCHDQELLVADLPELGNELADARINTGRHRLEMLFLSVLAGEAVGTPVDGDGDFAHGPLPTPRLPAPGLASSMADSRAMALSSRSRRRSSRSRSSLFSFCTASTARMSSCQSLPGLTAALSTRTRSSSACCAASNRS